MNGNGLFGVRSLIAYALTLTALGLTIWLAPDQLSLMITGLMGLFGLLLGRKKANQEPKNE